MKITSRWLLALLGLSGAAGAAQTPSPATAGPAVAEVATFAGGCFWCMQPPFDKLPGVKKTVVGYIGGHTPDPNYKQVSAGGTGHAEAVQVTFDPARVTYAQLLDVFWHNIDPLAKDRQFCDAGDQYRTAIFYHSPEQQKAAAESLKALESSRRFGSPVRTQVVAAGAFHPAEEYHQDYYKKNPARYHFYRWNCGRDQRLQELWGAAK